MRQSTAAETGIIRKTKNKIIVVSSYIKTA